MSYGLAVDDAQAASLTQTVPESPRWQMRHGQEDKAINSLAELHANGDASDELVQYELAEMRESLAKDEGLASVSYLEFFKTKGNRRRLLVTCVIAAGAQLGGNTLVSYYLAPILRLIGITDPPQQAGINAGLVCSLGLSGDTFADRQRAYGGSCVSSLLLNLSTELAGVCCGCKD